MARFKRKRIDNEVERRLATGMIVSDHVIKEVKIIWDPNLIEVPFVRLIGEWCLKYYDRYQQAPGKHIQDLFNTHVRKGMDDDLARLVEDFLEEISSEYERASKFNALYLLDEIEERFKLRSLANLSEDMQTELTNGDPANAEALMAKYKRVARPATTGANPWNDIDGIQDAFEKHVVPLFTFPGAFGEMVNDQIVRGGLIGLMGRAKIGKSWQLMEWAYRAARARCNVALIQVGDMTQEEMTLRLHTRLAGRSHLTRYCKEMIIPVLDCTKNQEGTCHLKQRTSDIALGNIKTVDDTPDDYEPCSYCAKKRPHNFQGATFYERIEETKPLVWRQALKLGKKFMSRLRGRHFKLISFPNSSVCVQNIETLLDNWEQFEGFVPDVVVIDYADILAPEPELSRKDTRDQQNGSWKALRRLAQKRHVFVLTATQADAASYTTNRLRLVNFSEDRRKYDHVTGMLGLNQTEDDKDAGQMRIGWLLLRQGEFDASKMVVVLQCLQRGMCHVGSYWQSFRKKKQTKEEE